MLAVPDEAPDKLLEACLSPDAGVALPASRRLFREVIEPLADSFDASDCDRYTALFAPVLARLDPELSAAELLARYQRIRTVRSFRGDPAGVRTVFVLSRVTLGADVAVTSVVLDAARQRFPSAAVCLVGPRKNYELFAADPRVQHVDLPYPRSATLLDRVRLSLRLRRLVDQPDAIVLDPDSRLTQLGLVPVCREENYYFFESRTAGGDGPEPLAVLTARWLQTALGVEQPRAFIAPAQDPVPDPPAEIAVSLGVGENPAKGLPDPWEAALIAMLVRQGCSLLIDMGAGAEEAERVGSVVARSGGRPGQVRTILGSFARFAAAVSSSRFYLGYDSSGQHVAAACGVPLVTIFAGFPCRRFLDRWSPYGPGPRSVVVAEGRPAQEVLEEVLARIGEHWDKQREGPVPGRS